VRLGISWRTDVAEPGVLIVNRVIPGSPADLAGIRLNDRIYSAASQQSLSTESFLSLVATTSGELELQIESSGQPRFAKVMLSAVE
jgi:S1-C subfamily serine protease